jgi:hypothetical protein
MGREYPENGTSQQARPPRTIGLMKRTRPTRLISGRHISTPVGREA